MNASHNKKPSKTKVFSFRFDDCLKQRFAEKCRKSGKSQSEALRILMEYSLSIGICALREQVAEERVE